MVVDGPSARTRLTCVDCSTWQDRLANPAQFGGQASKALDVVVLSLPGYVFSGAPDRPFFWRDAPATFASLMTEVLGYDRFVAHGSATLALARVRQCHQRAA
jgi:hypothetical protein